MEEKLWKIFNNINVWLKHAENKNIIIISFISLISIISYIIQQNSQASILRIILIAITCLCFLITWITMIISFFPKIKIPIINIVKGGGQRLSNTDNLLFYGDIVKYSVDEYRNKLMEKYNWESNNIEFLNDLITQIITNSLITVWKYKCFKFSIFPLIAGILTFFISLLIIILN